jgi:hypothetical protein
VFEPERVGNPRMATHVVRREGKRGRSKTISVIFWSKRPPFLDRS